MASVYERRTAVTDSELVAYIRWHFMLEAEAKGSGTEGRTPAKLWHLPFGKTTNNQFGEIIKVGLCSVGGNSYYDSALADLELLLGKCEGTTPESDRAFAVTST
jgi:hypothetical protein